VLERRGEVGSGLAVGAEPPRALPRSLRVLEHGGAVTGRRGMVRQARRLGAPGQRRQRRPVQGDAPVGRELVLDRRARDLVAEADRLALRAQHPGCQARLELGQLVRRDPLQQPDLRARPRHGHGLQQPPRRSAQAPRPGEHGVAHAPRRARAFAREYLGHVERVAARAGMKCGAVDAVRRGQAGDSARRQRLDRDAMGRRQVPEHEAQRVVALQRVVAVRRDHQRRHPLHPPAEQLHDVQRRLVGPVEILQDDHGRLPDRAAQRPEDLAGGCAPLGHLGQLAAHFVGDVDQRSERSRREERLARPGQHAAGPLPLAERTHERRLADPSLAAEHDHLPAPAATHLREAVVELREVAIALQQLHSPTLGPRRPRINRAVGVAGAKDGWRSRCGGCTRARTVAPPPAKRRPTWATRSSSSVRV
jgi:hypothetical protein